MEYVFGGALAGVILLAVGLMVHEWTRTPGSGQTAGNPQHKCLECGHEFEVEPGDMPRERMLDAMDPALALADCPSCETPESSIVMTRCPNCERYYVGQRNQYWIDYGEIAPQDVSDVCPYCDTDREQYLREQRGR